MVATMAKPPVYVISASSHAAAGRQHGVLAAQRIHQWLDTPEMKRLQAFASVGPGKKALEALKRDNTRFAPHLAQEVRGIAEGAKRPIDHLWVATLINELDALMPDRADNAGHCSDVSAISSSIGTAFGFAHGHNEDWPGPVKGLWYFLSINSTAPGLASCTSMIYPGSMPGWASTWNSKGIFLTQNSLFPARSRPYGLASAFVQREAICGTSGAATSVDQVAAALKAGGAWAQAASVNVVDLAHRRMANVERYENRSGSFEVTRNPVGASNYSHFNRFKSLEVQEDGHRNSSIHRQAKLDSYPAPATVDDIAERLSDTTDSEYPIFREMTLATLLLDGLSRSLRVWCCGRAATSGPPDFSWSV